MGADVRTTRAGRIEIHPATPERWKDVEALFGKNGACAGCWCQFFKQTSTEFSSRGGDPNKRALRRSVQSGEVPGLIAYDGGTPVGWCALEPKGGVDSSFALLCP